MAQNDKILQQIALDGGEELIRQLQDVAEAGQKAFGSLGDAVKRLGNIDIPTDKIQKNLDDVGTAGAAAFKRIEDTANNTKLNLGTEQPQQALITLGGTAETVFGNINGFVTGSISDFQRLAKEVFNVNTTLSKVAIATAVVSFAKDVKSAVEAFAASDLGGAISSRIKDVEEFNKAVDGTRETLKSSIGAFDLSTVGADAFASSLDRANAAYAQFVQEIGSKALASNFRDDLESSAAALKDMLDTLNGTNVPIVTFDKDLATAATALQDMNEELSLVASRSVLGEVFDRIAAAFSNTGAAVRATVPDLERTQAAYKDMLDELDPGIIQALERANEAFKAMQEEQGNAVSVVEKLKSTYAALVPDLENANSAFKAMQDEIGTVTDKQRELLAATAAFKDMQAELSLGVKKGPLDDITKSLEGLGIGGTDIKNIFSGLSAGFEAQWDKIKNSIKSGATDVEKALTDSVKKGVDAVEQAFTNLDKIQEASAAKAVTNTQNIKKARESLSQAIIKQQKDEESSTFAVEHAQISLLEAQKALLALQGHPVDDRFNKELAERKAVLAVEEAEFRLQQAEQKILDDAFNNAFRIAKAKAEVAAAEKKARQDEKHDLEQQAAAQLKIAEAVKAAAAEKIQQQIDAEKEITDKDAARAAARQKDTETSIASAIKLANALAAGVQVIGDKVDTSAQNIARGFVASIGDSARQLKDFDGSLDGINKNGIDVSRVLNKLADLFKGTGDAAKNAAIASALGLHLTPEQIALLSKGSEGLRNAREQLEAIKALQKDFTSNNLEKFAESLQKIKDPAERLKKAIEVLGETFGTALVKSLNETPGSIRQALVPLDEFVRKTAADIQTARDFSKAIDDLKKAFTGLAGVGTGKLDLGLLIAPTATPILNAITEGIKSLKLNLKELAATIGTSVAPIIDDFFKTLAGAPDIQINTKIFVVIRDVLKSIGDAAKFVAKSLNDAFGTNISSPMLIIGGIITALIGGFNSLALAVIAVFSGGDVLKPFKESLKGVGVDIDAIKDKAKELFTDITAALAGNQAVVKNPWITSTIKGLQELGTTIKTFLSGAWTAFTEALSGKKQASDQNFKWIFEATLAIKDIVTAIPNAVIELTLLLAAVSGFVGPGRLFKAIVLEASGALTLLKDLLQVVAFSIGVVGGTLAALSLGVNLIAGAFTLTVGAALAWVAAIVGAIAVIILFSKEITAAADAVLNELAKISGAISKFAEDFFGIQVSAKVVAEAILAVAAILTVALVPALRRAAIAVTTTLIPAIARLGLVVLPVILLFTALKDLLNVFDKAHTLAGLENAFKKLEEIKGTLDPQEYERRKNEINKKLQEIKPGAALENLNELGKVLKDALTGGDSSLKDLENKTKDSTDNMLGTFQSFADSVKGIWKNLFGDLDKTTKDFKPHIAPTAAARDTEDRGINAQPGSRGGGASGPTAADIDAAVERSRTKIIQGPFPKGPPGEEFKVQIDRDKLEILPQKFIELGTTADSTATSLDKLKENVDQIQEKFKEAFTEIDRQKELTTQVPADENKKLTDLVEAIIAKGREIHTQQGGASPEVSDAINNVLNDLFKTLGSKIDELDKSQFQFKPESKPSELSPEAAVRESALFAELEKLTLSFSEAEKAVDADVSASKRVEDAFDALGKEALGRSRIEDRTGQTAAEKKQILDDQIIRELEETIKQMPQGIADVLHATGAGATIATPLAPEAAARLDSVFRELEMLTTSFEAGVGKEEGFFSSLSNTINTWIETIKNFSVPGKEGQLARAGVPASANIEDARNSSLDKLETIAAILVQSAETLDGLFGLVAEIRDTVKTILEKIAPQQVQQQTTPMEPTTTAAPQGPLIGSDAGINKLVDVIKESGKESADIIKGAVEGMFGPHGPADEAAIAEIKKLEAEFQANTAAGKAKLIQEAPLVQPEGMFGPLITAIQDDTAQTVEAIRQLAPTPATPIPATPATPTPATPTPVDTAISTALTTASSILTTINDTLTNFQNSIGVPLSALSTALTGLQEALNTQLSAIAQNTSTMVTWLQDLSARVTALNEIVSGIVASIDNASTNIQSKLDGVIQAVQANASSPVPGGAGGGFVRGPGTTTSDSILARLSRHEFVIKAAAVAKYGVSTFHALNNLRLPGFATGGPVTGSSTATGPISISDSFFGTQGIKTVTDAIDKSAETISGAIRNVISKLDSILATIGRTNDNTKVINDSINSGLQSIINAISGLSRQVSQQQAAAPQGSAGGGAVATDRGGVPVTTAQGPVTISQDGVISAIQDLKTAISSAFSAISTTLASIGQNIARMAGATPQAGTTGTPAAAPATPAAPGATGTPATSTDIQAITTVLNTISTTLSGDSAKLDTLNTSLTTEASSLGTGFQSIVTAIGSVVTAVQATTAAVQNISTAVDSAASRITDAISTASSGSGGSATELASGGPAGFIRGPGTKTSDSILARLSRGEFVHRAAAVDYYGLPFFHDINNLKFPKFNFGGQVRNISTIFNNATTNSLSTNLQVLDNLKKLPEFSMGGFVTDFGVMTRNSIPQLASGGPVDFGGDSGGNTGRALFLSIDGGKPHGPFTGQGKAVDHVEKEAVKHSISRIAKKPSWYTS